MKDHKFRQALFNRLGHFDDDLNKLPYKIVSTNDDIVSHAVDYFKKTVGELIYPSKSYAVAIVYGHLLEKNYGDEFYDSLNDPNLFCGNDKYFVTYSERPEIYDEILKQIKYGKGFALDLKLPQIEKTVTYFQQEFSFNG